MRVAPGDGCGRLWGVEIEPFASVLNLTGRPNVLYYRVNREGLQDGPVELLPTTVSPTNRIVSFGLDVALQK